ncbi:Uncharacterised protein [Mycobacteroides abscessus subsp. abscessus]|nr:Uncharacterised protein [Mycobacteroides abscessus subsp. abscessus]
MIEARVVDGVEEVLEGAGHVAKIGGGAEQITVGIQHVRDRRGKSRPDHHLDPGNLRVVGAFQYGFQ